MRRAPPALSDRPAASFKVVFSSVCDDRHAGTKPNSSPVRIEMPKVNASTGKSTRICCSIGNISGTTLRSRRTPHAASSQSQCAAGQCQDQTFGEQLADDARTPRTERAANGDLLLARSGARQQQIRQIRAGDQQQQSDRAEQYQEHRTDAAGVHFGHGKQRDAPAGIGGRIGALQAARDRRSSRRAPAATVTPGFSRATIP